MNSSSPAAPSASGAAGCAARYGATLEHYNTVETAKDMDRIRAAVGDDKLNYLGFSYGTELGAVYAHLFPQRIRVAVFLEKKLLELVDEPGQVGTQPLAPILNAGFGVFQKSHEQMRTANAVPARLPRQPQPLADGIDRGGRQQFQAKTAARQKDVFHAFVRRRHEPIPCRHRYVRARLVTRAVRRFDRPGGLVSPVEEAVLPRAAGLHGV